MCECGVLDRDISWYNVMCHPKHYVNKHPMFDEVKILERPCIEAILYVNDVHFVCFLVADE